MRLTVETASKSFPGVKALDRVSLDLRPGEIHALMGENGAGKSTLIKIITGVYQPDEGRVTIDGGEVRFASPRDAIAAGISAVHQERNLVPRFSVGENIALERLPTRHGLIDYAEVDREARRYLDLLDRGIDTRAEVRTLSVAQMQIVEIAKALSLEAKCLLLDEPTASITEHETAALFTLLRRLRGEGVAMLFVSHKLEEVFAIADRVTVLRDGRNAAEGVPIAEMSRQKLVSLMIGREERIAKIRERTIDAADVVMEARGLATTARPPRHRLQPPPRRDPRPLRPGRRRAERTRQGDARRRGHRRRADRPRQAGEDPRHARGARARTASAMSARTGRARA